jgi:membrane-associated protease RseP (regulator of RpoE activity)
MTFYDFIYTQRYDLIALVIFIFFLFVFLRRNKQNIVVQKILGIGEFTIFSMFMVKKSWGIALMKSWATKYSGVVRFFGLFSIIVGVIGLIANFFLLGMIIWSIFKEPAAQQVGLVLPFTTIPGLGYLSFTHWIIAIAILATVHEFAHGVVAKLYHVPIKSSGVAVFNIWKIPFIPAAFVEPDEKIMPTKSAYVQNAILAAGPTSNILLAIPLFLLLLWSTWFVSNHATIEEGFSFVNVTEGFPAYESGIREGLVFVDVNGVPTTNANSLYEILDAKKPGDELTLTSSTGETFTFNLAANPDNASRAYMGVMGPHTRLEYGDSYKPFEGLISWFIELIKWLFLFNFLIGLMNLMPLYITDGGQIVKVYAQKFIKDEKLALRTYDIICRICLWILLLSFIVPIVLGFF